MHTETWACYNRNEEERAKSSSGGVYILLAKYILYHGGVVFAVRYDENLETYHYKIDNEHDLLLSLGAKYIPSRLGDTFKAVKQCLLDGKTVLFVGTPCQNAGLISYLHYKTENLVLIDFVCHGVPSKIAWRKFIAEFDVKRRILDIKMRDKTMGWSRYSYDWKIELQNNKFKIIPQLGIPFMQGFVEDVYLRPSCYTCQFKGIERKTDITIGDYWGVWDLQADLDDNKGTSLLLVHTEKGKLILQNIAKYMVYESAPIQDVTYYNPSIIYSAKKTNKREIFFEMLEDGKSFNDIMKEVIEKPIQQKTLLKMKIKCRIKTILDRMWSIV